METKTLSDDKPAEEMKTNTTLISYHGDAQLKADFVKELEWHREQDKFLRGTYSEGSNGDFRGCAVGCSLHSLFKLGKVADYGDYSSHHLYETLLGLPEWLAHLEDWIFEHVPEDYTNDWPIEFAKAINPGSDLTIARHRILVYILEEEVKFDRKEFPMVDKVVTDCAALHNRMIAGGSVTNQEWSAAESAAELVTRSAESASRSVAVPVRSSAELERLAEESLAKSAAGSAVRSAERSTTVSAPDSVAWSAAESARSATESARSEALLEAESVRLDVAKRVAAKTLEILRGSK